MNTSIRVRVRRSALALLIATASLLAATSAMAQQRTHQINWGHTEPESVSHFVVLIADEEGDVAGARQIPVGKPQATPTGAFFLYSALVAFEPDEFLAVAAVGFDGQMSVPSDWGAMPPTRPGQPRPAGN